jgi:hypothetical protein
VTRFVTGPDGVVRDLGPTLDRIKHDLYNQLNGLVGKADMNKFLAALKKGIVGPTGESGIKIFNTPIGKYTHELKIGGSAQRLLGYIDENGVLIFDKFVRRGLH